jgi:hypothetical protein
MADEKPSDAQLLELGVTADSIGAEMIPAIITALSEIPDASTDLATMGAVLALHGKFPNLPYWQDGAGAAIYAEVQTIATLPPDYVDPKWNRYFLGRWAATGEPNALRELVRRARHRDGTTSALVVGTEAGVILGAAQHPEVVKLLTKFGFNPANVKPGNFPPGTETATEPTPAAAPAPAPPAAPAPVPPTVVIAPPPPPAQPIIPSTPGGIMGVSADTNAGMVVLAGTPISITAALALETDLVKRTRELLIPAESYQWLDEFDHSKAGLFTNDVPPDSNPSANVFGRGLPREQESGMACHGEVLQDRTTGRYSCKLYNRDGGGGFSQVADKIDDFNVAKFRVASAVKAELISIGLLKP